MARRLPSCSSACMRRGRPRSAPSRSRRRKRRASSRPRMAPSVMPKPKVIGLAHSRARNALKAVSEHVALDEGLADAAHQHQGELAALHLLVLGHESSSCSGAGVPPGMAAIAVGRPTAVKMALDAGGVGRRAKALLDREGEGEPHADGDGLAMQEPVRVAGEGFERMAEGVAEIEQGARAALPRARRPPRWLPWRGRWSRRHGGARPRCRRRFRANSASSQAKNGASPSSPYFTTSA